MGIFIHKKCATLEKVPTPGLTVKMKQDITGTIPRPASQPSRNPFDYTGLGDGSTHRISSVIIVP